jgi:hypothetical protein
VCAGPNPSQAEHVRSRGRGELGCDLGQLHFVSAVELVHSPARLGRCRRRPQSPRDGPRAGVRRSRRRRSGPHSRPRGRPSPGPACDEAERLVHRHRIVVVVSERRGHRPLDVATTGNPAFTTSRALATSHALGRTSGRGPMWRRRSASARSARPPTSKRMRAAGRGRAHGPGSCGNPDSLRNRWLLVLLL